MPPFPGPIATSGKIIVVAHIQAKPGQADKLQDLLAECRRAAYEDEEGTLTYRTTRGEGDKSDTFAVFEEYVLPKGLDAHVDNAPFKALAASGTVAELDIKYYNEFEKQ